MLIRAVAVLQANAHQLSLAGPLRVLVRQPSNDPLNRLASGRIADLGGDGLKLSDKTLRFVTHGTRPGNFIHIKNKLRMPVTAPSSKESRPPRGR